VLKLKRIVHSLRVFAEEYRRYRLCGYGRIRCFNKTCWFLGTWIAQG
jgi:hypothetical protein